MINTKKPIPIYNGTLKTFDLINNVEDIVVFLD